MSIIGMDHITGLPLTPSGFDAILTIRCLRTKLIKVIPSHTADTAADLARSFFSFIFPLFGRPDQIVSDRGPTFVSSFWKTLCSILGISLSFSSGYHAQTNGAADRSNQSIEGLVRIFTSHSHSDWDSALPLIEFELNTAPKRSLGDISPYMALYGFQPTFDINHTSLSAYDPSKSTQPALSFLLQWKNTRDAIQPFLTKAREDMVKFANRIRSPAPVYAPGDLVWLRSSHLPLTFDKLSDKYLGPFPIVSVISPSAVTLKLPPTWRVHPTFHVSSLKKYIPPSCDSQTILHTLPPEVVPGLFEVEAVLKFNRKTKRYLIKWRGYPLEESTWEPIAHLKECSDLIRQFHLDNPNIPQP